MRLPAAVLTAALLALAPGAALAGVGPDYVTSDNVEYVGSLKLDIGQTTGAKVVGNKLYVTSAKNLSIYDISEPDDAGARRPDPPQRRLGERGGPDQRQDPRHLQRLVRLHAELRPAGHHRPVVPAALRRARPANVKELPAVPQNGDHTSACVLDCEYFYGSAGSITDLRGVLDGAAAQGPRRLAPAGPRPARRAGRPEQVRPRLPPRPRDPARRPLRRLPAVRPDLGQRRGRRLDHRARSCWPGGSNADKRFVHSVRWPRRGRGQVRLRGRRDELPRRRAATRDGAFAVLDATAAATTGRLTPLGPEAEYRPSNGTYVDGNTPANAAGCSVHWFEEHPSLQERRPGRARRLRQRHALPAGRARRQASPSRATSSRWASRRPRRSGSRAPTSSTRSTTCAASTSCAGRATTTSPNALGRVTHSRGRVRGTNGRQPVLPALTARQRALRRPAASVLKAQGWFRGYCQLIADRA